MISKELSYEVLGCAFEVYNRLGPFLQEHIYQRALEVALTQKALLWERQVAVEILFEEEKVGHGLLDLLVEDEIILELKVADFVHPAHVSQVIQYLSITGLELGYVLNFGSLDKLEFKRVVLTKNSAHG
jgi:GxxExxY protein